MDRTPWPAWIRYPVVAVLAAIAVYGVGTAFGSGESARAAALRVAVCAVLVPALLAPVAFWASGRGRRRSDPRAPVSSGAPTAGEVAGLLRAAGYRRYADRIDAAGASATSSTEYLAATMQVLRDLRRDHPDLPPALDEQTGTIVRDLSALLN